MSCASRHTASGAVARVPCACRVVRVRAANPRLTGIDDTAAIVIAGAGGTGRILLAWVAARLARAIAGSVVVLLTQELVAG